MKLTRDGIYLVVTILLLALCGQFYYSFRYQPAHTVRVYYNHETEANKQVIDVIQNAHTFVYFAIYTFTRNDIKDALLGAKHRGLDVRGITDKDQVDKIDQQEKIIAELRNAGIPIEEQNHDGLMHIKTVVTDTGYASGSYNWTASATTSNDEILEVGHDETIRQQYQNAIELVLARNK